MGLVTWESYFGARSLAEQAWKNPSSMRDSTLPADGVSDAATATVRVSGGVWIADCPTDGCSGAEAVNFKTPLFFCCECRNAAYGNQAVAVALPDPDVRAGVEAALLARPAPATRHWAPPETADDLLAENEEHNV